MTMTNDTAYNRNPVLHDNGPLFTGIDILGGILVLIMILGPMMAGATHASHMGW